jgi:hypothetical protein
MSNDTLQATDDGVSTQRSSAIMSWLSLFTSSGTLICCAIPALLVTIGAGAALSSLVSAVPQIVWLSEHKAWVFGVAGGMLAVAGALQWRNRTAPCPVDPALRDACLRTRKLSLRMYWLSVAIFTIGVWFAFVQPLLM